MPSTNSAYEESTTFAKFMVDEGQRNPGVTDMEPLLSSIQMACRSISSLVARASITDLIGVSGVSAVGEEQSELDVVANELFKQALSSAGGKLGSMASSDERHPVLVDQSQDGKYVAVFDALEGSHCLDMGIATGTIFGIYEASEECLAADDADLDSAAEKCLVQTLQPAANLVAAGYCMYSSSTMLVISTGDGVNGFTLDAQAGEFILTHPDMSIKPRGKIFSVDEARINNWAAPLRKYIALLKSGSGESGVKYSGRHIGSTVADVHRTILYGGIYAVPADGVSGEAAGTVGEGEGEGEGGEAGEGASSTSTPTSESMGGYEDGRLHLVFEGGPLSFVMEQAGGKSSTGRERLLDIAPEHLRQRTPVFMGSPDDVSELEDLFAGSS